MEKRFDVTALGELLIDFTARGTGDRGDPLFEANPGGAPCNVLAMLRKLGHSAAFLGKVGGDMFGRMLREAAEGAGIDTAGLVSDPAAHTTLAFVRTLENGDRDFSFLRDPGADMLLTADELRRDRITDCRVFHFGSLSMTHGGVRAATERAVALARDSGALLSFDPNLRLPLWSGPDEARTRIEWGLAHCDILKIADDELLFVTGETDPDRGAAILRRRFSGIRLLCVTSGAEGSRGYVGDTRVFVPAFRRGGTVEPTGAGDAFCACLLHSVLTRGPDAPDEAWLTEALRFANAAAYLVTTRPGAFRSMPDRAAVEAVLRA